MTNSACTSLRKGLDCIARNSRNLCDACYESLTDSELRDRDIAITVQQWKRKAGAGPKGCQKIDGCGRTCFQREIAPCSGCIRSAKDSRLWRYAAKRWDRAEESAEYYRNLRESDAYAKELRAKGVTGVEWNIESCGNDLDTKYTLVALFQFSRPCFIHDEPEVAL